MKQLFVIAALLLSSFYASAQSVPDASTVLKEAYQKAKLFVQTIKQHLKESKENKWRRKFRAALVVAKSKM